MNIIFISYLILHASLLSFHLETNAGLKTPNVELNDYLELNLVSCEINNSTSHQTAYQIIKTKDLKVRIDVNSGIIDSLITLHNNVNWISSPGKIFSPI